MNNDTITSRYENDDMNEYNWLLSLFERIRSSARDFTTNEAAGMLNFEITCAPAGRGLPVIHTREDFLCLVDYLTDLAEEE